MGPLFRAAALAATATLVACGGNKLTQSGHSGSGSTGTIGSTGHLISSTTGGHGSSGTGTSATTGSTSGTAGSGSTTAGSTSASTGTSATTGSTGTSGTSATTGGGASQVELLPGAQHMSSPGHQLELRLTPESRATMGAPGGHKLKVGVVPPDVP